MKVKLVAALLVAMLLQGSVYGMEAVENGVDAIKKTLGSPLTESAFLVGCNKLFIIGSDSQLKCSLVATWVGSCIKQFVRNYTKVEPEGKYYNSVCSSRVSARLFDCVLDSLTPITWLGYGLYNGESSWQSGITSALVGLYVAAKFSTCFNGKPGERYY